MKPFAKSVSATMFAAILATFASSAGATPLSAGSLPLKDAAGTPAFESVQWRGWGGWRGGWGGWGGWRGGWGWGGLGIGLATGAIIGGALAGGPYYGYSPYYSGYSPYYYPGYSPYYYPPTYYSYYAPTYYGGYYGGDSYWPYRRYGYGIGHRSAFIRHY